MNDAFRESDTVLFRNIVTFESGFGVIADQPFNVGSPTTTGSNLNTYNQLNAYGGLSGSFIAGSGANYIFTGDSRSLNLSGQFLNFGKDSSTISLNGVILAGALNGTGAGTVLGISKDFFQVYSNVYQDGLLVINSPFGTCYLGDSSDDVNGTCISVDDLHSGISLLANSSIYFQTPKVGINNITPKYSLDVNGSGHFTKNLYVDSTGYFSGLFVSGQSITTGGPYIPISQLSNLIKSSGNVSPLAIYVSGYPHSIITTQTIGGGSFDTVLGDASSAYISIIDYTGSSNGISDTIGLFATSLSYSNNLYSDGFFNINQGQAWIGDVNGDVNNTYILINDTDGQISFSGPLADLNGNICVNLATKSLTGHWFAQNFNATSGISSNAYTMSGHYVNAKSGNYTLTNSDNGGLVTINTGSQAIVTVPNTLPQGFSCSVVQYGVGKALLSGSGGVNIRNRGGYSGTYGQWSLVSILQLDTGNYLLQGDVG